MANTDFGILLKTLLDKSGINSELEQVQKIVNKYSIDIMPELKTASLKNQMKAISQEIANDFNKTFGTNLTGNDVFKAYENQAKQAEKAVKEEAKAIEAARKEQESLTNAMAKGREQAELSRQAEQKRQQMAQNNAINKALEQEYQERQKNIEAARKQAELDKQNALAFTKSESERLSSAISKYSYGDTSDANAMMKQMNRGLSNFGDLSNVQGNITQLSSTVDKIIADLKLSHEQSLQVLNEEIKAEQTLQSQKDTFNKKNINAIDYEIQKREEEAKAFSSMLQAQMQEQQKMQSEVNKIQLSIDDKSYEAEIARLTNGFKVLSGDIIEAKTHTEALNKAYQAMVDATDDKTRLQAEKAYQLELSKTKNLLTIAQSEAKEYVDAFQVKKLRNDIQDWLKKNTAATKEARIAMESYLDDLSDVAHISQSTFKSVKSGMDNWDTSMRKIGRLGYSLTDTFKNGAKSFLQWTVSSTSIMEVIQGLRHMYQSVYDIDTAMTNLYKVTDETDARYNKFLTSACDNAKELGRSVSSLVEQTANWSKLGYSLDEAEELAKLSSVYANVAEVDDATAVSDMVTAMKAFNIESENAITIIDALNTLGNKYATSAGDLGAGLARSASAMAVAGTDMQKTLAMLTGGAEITQNADEFGNMLKVGSMRIQGMKGKLEELGEEVDENVESISKMQTQVLNLTHGDVNIFDSTGNFRDYYDIMKDISEVYDELSSTERASLMEILFGKQRGNQGAALIQAFQSGQIEKAYADIQNSAGSAYEEQARWMESLEAKTQQFEAAFQSLSHTILDSGLVKWFVDFGTGAVTSLDWIIEKVGTLGTIGIGTAGILGAKGSGLTELCYIS